MNAKGADNAFTPLMEAADDGSIEIIKLLLAKGADINAKNEDGDTALIGASFAGNTELVALLSTVAQMLTLLIGTACPRFLERHLKEDRMW